LAFEPHVTRENDGKVTLTELELARLARQSLAGFSSILPDVSEGEARDGVTTVKTRCLNYLR
jgi:hypothetical protein